MVEVVDGLEVEKKRGVFVLLEDRRRAEGRLQAVRPALSNDTAERPQGLAPFLVVVQKGIEPPLDRPGCFQGIDEPSLFRREGGAWRTAWQRTRKATRD